MKIFRIILVYIIIGITNGYAFDYVMGTTLYPYSAQTKPIKGGTYLDLPYNTMITRVTDAKNDYGGFGAIASYATWNPLSSDGRFLLFGRTASVSAGGGFTLYDAITFQWIENPPIASSNGQDAEPRWDRSGNYPSRIYYRKNMTLRYYDVSTKVDNLVHDFIREFPDYSGYYVFNGEEGYQSADGRYWAFILRNGVSPFNSVRVFVYDMANDNVVASKVITKTPNNVMMSPSGDYVYVAWAWNGGGDEYDGPHMYKRDFSSNIKITTDIPHGNFAYTAQGNEVYYFLHEDYITFVKCSNGQKFRLYYQGDLGWASSNLLFSAGTLARKGWGIISTYSRTTATDYPKWDYNQIFAIELDENKVYGGVTLPRIWRIAHTQNYFNLYYSQPNAQVDHNLTRVWFGANWRDPSAAPDVYQVTLPTTWWEDLGGVSDGPVILSATPLPVAREGTAYQYTLVSSGGIPPYTWSISGLPIGIEYDPSTGVISGTPSNSGAYIVSATITGGGATTMKTFSLVVEQAMKKPFYPEILGISP